MCKVCVAKGAGLLKYSFPPPHPFNSSRASTFWEELSRRALGQTYVEPVRADEETVELFHEKSHFEFVKKASKVGDAFLDQGDTPAYQGVLEAAEFAVGTTVFCVEKVIGGVFDHAFNPVGGLHHARPDGSAGFCVFNDIGVAINLLRRKGLKRILYVDIDVHHGDGVFYPYETDPDVFIFDVHENGRFLYPGTGREDETGRGKAKGTKRNLALLPGEGDERIEDILRDLEEFATKARPEFMILQAGADSLQGDTLGGLIFTEEFHARVSGLLHDLSHESCGGRLVGLGGGGYNVDNCANAWTSVVKSMKGKERT